MYMGTSVVRRTRLQELCERKGIERERSKPVVQDNAHPTERTQVEDAALNFNMMSARKILSAVGRDFNLPPDRIIARCNEERTVLARHITCYLIRDLTKLSLTQIGRYMGPRDHTTVLHGVQKIERFLPTDRRLRATVDRIKRAITQEQTEHRYWGA